MTTWLPRSGLCNFRVRNSKILIQVRSRCSLSFILNFPPYLFKKIAVVCCNLTHIKPQPLEQNENLTHLLPLSSHKELKQRKMASSIGIMDSAYFVGRSEILSWINSTLHLNLSKVEEVFISVLSRLYFSPFAFWISISLHCFNRLFLRRILMLSHSLALVRYSAS